jgi:hypothetical protein
MDQHNYLSSQTHIKTKNSHFWIFQETEMKTELRVGL